MEKDKRQKKTALGCGDPSKAALSGGDPGNAAPQSGTLLAVLEGGDYRGSYSEDALVEQPAIALLAELGWETVNAYHEFDYGLSTLDRETRAEVILKSRLRLALLRINPEVSIEAIHQAIEELTRDRSRMSMAAANKEIYHLLKNGVRVPVPDPEGDGETVAVVRVVDWDNPVNNDFLLCSQFWITGEMHTRRADLVGFVNGLPLVFIELKAAHRRLETAFTGNLRDYKDTVPQLFWSNALIILSNGSQSRVGSVTAGWEHFAEWKKVGSEDEAGRVSLETMLRGVCDPARLLDLVENFCLFQEVPGGLIKLTAKNHQYLGVNNAIAALLPSPPAFKGRFLSDNTPLPPSRGELSVRGTPNGRDAPLSVNSPLEGGRGVLSDENLPLKAGGEGRSAAIALLTPRYW